MSSCADSRSFTNASLGGVAARIPAWRHEPARLRLPLKTTLLLLTLLVGVVFLCGGIFLGSTRSILEKNKASQVTQFAYATAALIDGRDTSDPKVLQEKLEALGKVSGVEFMVFTDPAMHDVAGYISKAELWRDYRAQLGGGDRWMSSGVGKVRQERHGEHVSYILAVPLFNTLQQGSAGGVLGYLHLASSGDGDAAQLRYLQGFVLVTCMGVVLLAVPIAGLIARHITVPIQRLADAALALAGGDLAHRVTMKRSDEIGDLMDAFNRMADTVQQQQRDIKQINAGLEDTVRGRTAQLEKVNNRLTAEMAEKEDFLRAVSHDLNAPLRNIAGMTSMLILKYRDTLEKDAMQRLERIQKNVAVESELINELLELSRIKSRREKIERVDLHELINGVAEAFSADLEMRRITLRVESTFPAMRGEKSRLRQVFQNLIDNAVKYMREEGEREIILRMEWRGDEAVFIVRDSGIGIAPEDLPHLFHVFRRAKNASVMKIPGKGVGLASVKSILENYDARMWVESVHGQGTTFHFAIPRSHFDVVQEVAA